tara:strand:- start:547 stop:843 length:297 start_codon:yes stop_codon:yes gene_type:complete
MPTIYYNNNTDYLNSNRFKDKVEGNSKSSYNAFLSPTSVDLYYKTNDRTQTINFQTGNFIPLSVNDIGLRPGNFTVNSVDNSRTVINYNNNTPSVTRN